MTVLISGIQNDRYSSYFCSSLTAILQEDHYFQPFYESTAHYSLPEKFTNPFQDEPHPLCLLAAKELQDYLHTQTDWEHNFGLDSQQDGTIIGKMFGVLVVKTQQNKVGFLAAFSGKLAGVNEHSKFVPAVYDALKENSFLNIGMTELNAINLEIKALETDELSENSEQINTLKQFRKQHSIGLQNKLFDHYIFLNTAGEAMNLRSIFKSYNNTNPPAGAGECAAPKLLHYAFQQDMQPLAISEFWWGLSPKSEHWKHGHFYPACQQKCAPILSHMLKGIVFDEKQK
jgi:tRNA pseudouridine32 synthase/23S rRNA pseudouridine746 synthase